MIEIAKVDVLVVGGGPAGIGAALGAAKAGAKTLLLERYAFFGGVASQGMGMPINQVRPGGRPRSAVHEHLVGALQSYGPDAVQVVGHALVCNVEYLKAATMDALDAWRCPYLLHTRAVDAIVRNGRIEGVVVATKQGLIEARAKAVVDATGDADIAFLAGAETLKGREEDGFLSPMTLCVLITNVDVPAAREANRLDRGFRDLVARARLKYPLLPERFHFELGPFPMENALVINHSGTKAMGSLDGTSPYDMTAAEKMSRHQALQMVAALREFGGPAFANVQIAGAGNQVGVRETRRVKGVYQLTEADALSGARFDDAIAWRSGMLDIGFVRYEEMQVHDVPYRALLPEAVDGLLAAGRCISASHVAASAGKSMGNCLATGHAAGLAAALAATTGRTPREVPVAEIQARLAADGVDLKRAG
jgi:succinate dehydrogenase/fumarate reductase flavoprotein subunit